MDYTKLIIKEIKTTRIDMFYEIILAEENGNQAISISIGKNEADNIALCLDKIYSEIPLTFDTIINIMNRFDISLKEVIINGFHDGIYRAIGVFNHKDKEAILDMRPSDAINIAIRSNSPIFAIQNIIDEVGFDYTSYYNDCNMQSSNTIENIENLSIFGLNMLEDLLKDAIEKEDYITASLLRDKINDLKKHS